LRRSLSSQAQTFCIESGIDFLDLAGNVFINVPGKFTLQRNGMRASSKFAHRRHRAVRTTKRLVPLCQMGMFKLRDSG
jgi:hypothetical protein